MASSWLLSAIFVICLTFSTGNEWNKYSKEANEDIRKQESPFRMQKINLLWQKAIKKLDLEELDQLYFDFKQQDADELNLKKLKADNQDKDGLKEAEVRRQLRMIMKKYAINQDVSNDNNDELKEFTFFKDKKLDKLWKKAEKLDLTDQQLKVLKEELLHYQEKLHHYHQLISDFEHKDAKQNAKKDEIDNHISFSNSLNDSDQVKNDFEQSDNKIKEKHNELKEEYRRLSDIVYQASTGNHLKEFDEERALKLWKLALKSDFNDNELVTLKEELFHFQNRIKKLNFFESQLESDIMTGKKVLNEFDQPSHQKHIVNRVKDLNENVNMLHNKIERKILQRHTEL